MLNKELVIEVYDVVNRIIEDLNESGDFFEGGINLEIVIVPGYAISVYFLQVPIWDSENDVLPEDLEEYIRKELKAFLQVISNIKL